MNKPNFFAQSLASLKRTRIVNMLPGGAKTEETGYKDEDEESTADSEEEDADDFEEENDSAEAGQENSEEATAENVEANASVEEGSDELVSDQAAGETSLNQNEGEAETKESTSADVAAEVSLPEGSVAISQEEYDSLVADANEWKANKAQFEVLQNWYNTQVSDEGVSEGDVANDTQAAKKVSKATARAIEVYNTRKNRKASR